jgi:hypothetical protein
MEQLKGNIIVESAKLVIAGCNVFIIGKVTPAKQAVFYNLVEAIADRTTGRIGSVSEAAWPRELTSSHIHLFPELFKDEASQAELTRSLFGTGADVFALNGIMSSEEFETFDRILSTGHAVVVNTQFVDSSNDLWEDIEKIFSQVTFTADEIKPLIVLRHSAIGVLEGFLWQ